MLSKKDIYITIYGSSFDHREIESALRKRFGDSVDEIFSELDCLETKITTTELFADAFIKIYKMIADLEFSVWYHTVTPRETICLDHRSRELILTISHRHDFYIVNEFLKCYLLGLKINIPMPISAKEALVLKYEEEPLNRLYEDLKDLEIKGIIKENNIQEKVNLLNEFIDLTKQKLKEAKKINSEYCANISLIGIRKMKMAIGELKNETKGIIYLNRNKQLLLDYKSEEEIKEMEKTKEIHEKIEFVEKENRILEDYKNFIEKKRNQIKGMAIGEELTDYFLDLDSFEHMIEEHTEWNMPSEYFKIKYKKEEVSL